VQRGAGARDAEAWAAIDRVLCELTRRARILPALHPRNAAEERARLEAELARGGTPAPRWDAVERRDTRGLLAALDRTRRGLAEALPPELAALYAARLDELELDVALLDAACEAGVGDPRRVRPLAARRYGTGADLVDGTPLRAIAAAILAEVAPEDEAATVPAEALAAMMLHTARAVGLSLSVRVEARLSAGAAAGDHTIFVQARRFGPIEARRLVAHEVLGHAVASSRALAERLRIFEIGTAGSFADQEGLAIALEEEAGALDAARLRILAARVVATDRLHAGASFGETARALVDRWGLTARVAITTTERAYRGGGVARDAAYLEGFLRVRAALARGAASVDELRAGRVSVTSLPALRWASARGWASAPREVGAVEMLLAEGGCPPGLPPARRALVARALAG
jgi:hypothetical protein